MLDVMCVRCKTTAHVPTPWMTYWQKMNKCQFSNNLLFSSERIHAINVNWRWLNFFWFFWCKGKKNLFIDADSPLCILTKLSPPSLVPCSNEWFRSKFVPNFESSPLKKEHLRFNSYFQSPNGSFPICSAQWNFQFKSKSLTLAPWNFFIGNHKIHDSFITRWHLRRGIIWWILENLWSSQIIFCIFPTKFPNFCLSSFKTSYSFESRLVCIWRVSVWMSKWNE